LSFTLLTVTLESGQHSDALIADGTRTVGGRQRVEVIGRRDLALVIALQVGA